MGGDIPTFRLQVSGGVSNINPSELDDARKVFGWGGSGTPANGTFDSFNHTDVGVGIAVGPGHLMFHYIKGTQELKNTDIAGTSYSVQDKFVYASKYIMYDVPIQMDEWLFSFGAGVGQAERFDYHENVSYGDDITWSANPTGYRARASVGYLYNKTIGLFFEAGYEYMKSGLTASTDYPNTTIGGRPIQGGDKLINMRTRKEVEADISGGRFGLGLIVMF
jgi:hypothetical protein